MKPAIADNGSSPRELGETIMTYGQAAQFLGISERSLERYVSEGLIPYVRLPKRGAWAGVRFLRSDLLGWLERQTVRPRRAKLPGLC
jgi:excisionase family DNA binding protein